jgi:hypothetical protein
MAITAAVHTSPRWHCLHNTAARLSGLRKQRCSPLTFPYTRSICATTTAAASATPAAAMATHTVPGDAVHDRISLTSEERALFDTLLAAAKFAGSNTVLRAAGGWVRDKLLGKESKDIDIALDNMLGKDFADKVGDMFHVTLCSVLEKQLIVLQHQHISVCVWL